LSPLAPASGVPVGRDGLAGPVFFDAATNRINAAGWQYDAAGNQTRAWDGTAWQRMEYDMAGRLATVKTDAGAVLATYTYGDSTARLVTQEGPARTYYAWGPGGVTAEYAETDGTTADTTPQWGKNYIYLGGRLLATQQPGGAGEVVQYHHPDRLGTRLVSNAADTGHFEQATLPFGSDLAAESTGATGRRFTSYDRSNATGLDYAVNRSYDPQQGRFTTVDPIEMEAVDLDAPQTLNLYAYCGNDPVNRTDPSGLLFGWLGKLFKGIWKVITSKAFVIAATVALTVISAGASLGLLALKVPAAITLNLGTLAATYTPAHITAWGWAAIGLGAALAAPKLTSLSGIIGLVAGYALGEAVGHTLAALGGSVGIGGTPDWNSEANGFQRRDRRPQRSRRRRRGYTVDGRFTGFGYYRPSWHNPVFFRGNKVYRSQHGIDPNRRDAQGRTNLERMQAGEPPLGSDGVSMQLHHMLQTQNGPIIELTATQHRQWYRTIHINPNTIPSGINRSAFNTWKRNYWKARAQDFIYGPVNPWEMR
ncbi:MAG: hypothetical protein M3416_19225, partial [Acidobacteriota bacterium]|nr:hypothetical protein [Acidobacteriota bacterium]